MVQGFRFRAGGARCQVQSLLKFFTGVFRAQGLGVFVVGRFLHVVHQLWMIWKISSTP